MVGDDDSMAMIKCPECYSSVSDKAQVCPKCGFPISSITINTGLYDENIVKSYLKRADKLNAWQYIARATGCSPKEASNKVNKILMENPLLQAICEEHYPSEYNDYSPRSVPKCPTCGSTNIKRISGTERAASVFGLGLFSKKINKSFKCENCGYTW